MSFTINEYKKFITKLDKDEVSLLNIGQRHDSDWWWYKEIKEEVDKVTCDILDIWPANIDYLHSFNGQPDEGIHLNYNPILGDVRTWEPIRRYDLVIWNHGPEHLLVPDAVDAMKKLINVADWGVFVSCPDGSTMEQKRNLILYKGVALFGNPAEEHVSLITHENFFSRVGMHSKSDGKDLVGVKYV